MSNTDHNKADAESITVLFLFIVSAVNWGLVMPDHIPWNSVDFSIVQQLSMSSLISSCVLLFTWLVRILTEVTQESQDLKED
jgi:hypothetical protein